MTAEQRIAEQIIDGEISALKSRLDAWKNHRHERALTLDSNWCQCGNRWPCIEKQRLEQSAELEARIGRLQSALYEANARDANGREQASKNALWYATELRQQSEAIAELRKHAWHSKWCKLNPWIYPSPECSCGLNNLLKRLPQVR